MDRLSPPIVPDARGSLLPAAAEPRPPGLDVAKAGEDRAGHQHHHRRREPPPPDRLRIALQIAEQAIHRGIARLRVHLEAAQDHRPQPSRHLRPRRHLAEGRPHERPLAVERLEEGHAEAELVGTGVHRDPPELLGCHVGGSAEDQTPFGGKSRQLATRLWSRLGEPEVGNAHPAVPPQKDVLGLEIAMDQSGGVRGGETAPGGKEASQDLTPGPGGRPQPPEPLPQSLPFDQLHGHEHPVAERPGVVHRHHVRIGEPGQRLRLAQQPQAVRIAAEAIRPQQLQRYPAVELGVVRGIDHPHAAGPDAVEHYVAADRSAASERLRASRKGGPRSLSEQWDGRGLVVDGGTPLPEIPISIVSILAGRAPAASRIDASEVEFKIGKC
jgi:hypothetical protein